MKKKIILQFSWRKLYFYFLLIPFFHPRGFSEFNNTYKSFFAAWLLASCVAVCVHFLINALTRNTKLKKSIFVMLLYYISFVAITFYAQKTLTEGYQKLFVAPVFAMLFAVYMMDYKDELLDCISKILIVIFSLNLTVFSPYFYPQYFSYDSHIVFIGHVQIASQVGTLGLFVALLMLNDSRKKLKSKILMILCVTTMLLSETIVSYVSLAMFVLAYLIYKSGIMKKVFLLNPVWYVLGWIVINILFFVYSEYLVKGKIDWAYASTLSGRTYIWDEVIRLTNESPVIGYGAYGVKIVVFWHEWLNNGLGMNYAHNEFLQRILDGGIVLLILFIFMLLSYIKNLKFVKDEFIRYISSVSLVIFLCIMFIESVTEYYYIFAFLSILLHLSHDKGNEEEETKNMKLKSKINQLNIG